MILAFATTLVAATEVRGAGGGDLELEIGNLYRDPSLIGTRPGSVAWSPDSTSVAFSWHDGGGRFRDLWTWSPGQPQPLRLTTHGEQDGASGEGVSEVTWLGAGTVAYTLDDALMLRPTDGGPAAMLADLSPRSLTASPDGAALAYANRAGLWLLAPGDDDPRPTRLVAPEDGVRIGSFEWSKDGRRIVFLAIDPRPLPEKEIHFYTRDGHQLITPRRAFPGEPTAEYRVGVVDVPAGMVRYLPRPADADYVWNYGISADGARVFVNGSDPLVKHHRIDVYDLATGTRELFYEEHDPEHLRPDWRAAWAPEDEGLVILTDRDGYLHLYHRRDARSDLKQLTSGAWEIAEFEVRGNRAYFLANRSHFADRQLYRVPVSGGEVEAVTADHDLGRGTHRPTISPDGRHVVSLFSDDRTPHDLHHIDVRTKASTRITRSPDPDFERGAWADVRYLSFPSRTDPDVTLVGRLSVPPDFDPERRYPLIVGSVYSDSVTNQWGGRQAHPTWGLDQALVARGYLLLAVNVRGSWGQGRAHNQGLRHGYGIVDIEDLASGVEHLVDEGFVDPARVGIWGSSYGGLMTMMSLFEKPGVYAAGIAGAPATNVAHAYPGQRWVMGPETGDDQPGRYESQSPRFHSAGLEDPLMIIHGTRDQVVLYSDTIALAQDLIDREQPFELVTLPGVGHGWDAEAPEVRRFAFRKMIAFFDRHLQPR